MEKAPPKTYCQYIRSLGKDEQPIHRLYHDKQYGYPLPDDNELFCRLVLEINQAGLSWTTILNKQENFRNAYDQFHIEKVAGYKAKNIRRLLNNAGIIRNRLKIEAAIHNAGIILRLQEDFGSFKNWLDHHHPLSIGEWTALFRKNFRFTGGEIVKEFLLSTGYLAGAHETDCPVYRRILKTNPAWNRKSSK